MPKNWCFQTLVLEKTPGSPLDSKEIKPINLKGNQPWIFIGRTDAEIEAPILWPPDVKNWLIWKDLDAGKGWRQEEKGTTEGEMVGWHHWLNGHDFVQTLGDSEGQGSLVCCSLHRVAKSWTWLSNWTAMPPLLFASDPVNLELGQVPWMEDLTFTVTWLTSGCCGFLAT